MGYSYGSNTRGWELRLMSFTGTNSLYWDTNTGSVHGAGATTSLSTGGWHHLVGTWNGTTWILYLDGASFATSTDSQAPQNNGVHVVAGALASSVGSPFFNTSCLLDELRVSNTARSADWVATEYNNQSAPSSFYTIGAQQGGGGASTDPPFSPWGSPMGYNPTIVCV
jgi:hypothetical protein